MEDDGQKGNVAEVLHHPLRVAFETCSLFGWLVAGLF
jgi:hypothetical protein